jgi:hypothetical protein
MNSLRKLVLVQVLWLAGLPALAAAAGQIDVGDPSIALGSPVTEGALDSVRGRDGLRAPDLSSQFSQSSLSATVSGNTLGGGTTGTNQAGDAVFSGASGIATMIQNSGSQVIIQNNVTINLSLK